MEKFSVSEKTHETIRILAVLAFAVWVIQSPFSAWWILLAAIIAL